MTQGVLQADGLCVQQLRRCPAPGLLLQGLHAGPVHLGQAWARVGVAARSKAEDHGAGSATKDRERPGDRATGREAQVAWDGQCPTETHLGKGRLLDPPMPRSWGRCLCVQGRGWRFRVAGLGQRIHLWTRLHPAVHGCAWAEWKVGDPVLTLPVSLADWESALRGLQDRPRDKDHCRGVPGWALRDRDSESSAGPQHLGRAGVAVVSSPNHSDLPTGLRGGSQFLCQS